MDFSRKRVWTLKFTNDVREHFSSRLILLLQKQMPLVTPSEAITYVYHTTCRPDIKFYLSLYNGRLFKTNLMQAGLYILRL